MQPQTVHEADVMTLEALTDMCGLSYDQVPDTLAAMHEEANLLNDFRERCFPNLVCSLHVVVGISDNPDEHAWILAKRGVVGVALPAYELSWFPGIWNYGFPEEFVAWLEGLAKQWPVAEVSHGN